MYSVEDLLISHGYKLPNKHHEILENRPGPRTVNGYERGPVVPFGNGGGTRQPQVYGGSCPNNNNEPRDRSQPRREGEIRTQAQAQAQAQVQVQAQAQARSREREAALHQWRMATERKCQSLGTDEWRPAVSFARQLSQSEGERWAQEQQRLHARTPEGMVVHPRTKAKSQSLPRMLQPESLQFVDIASSGQELYRRVNGHPLSHHDLYRPRFTRPPRPPSYEMHQQIRGSCEVLSGRDSAISQARDRTPLPISRAGDPQLDYLSQDSGPPGYIPPPSYKRAPIMGGGRRGYGEIAVDYRGDLYQQIQVAPDGSHWFTRHPVGSWPDPQRERSMSSQKQLYPVYTTQEHPGGGIQYIPFDDPRIRHISSALGGNSLTDADKIRHIRNELPSVTVSEPAPDDSAFLPPPLGPFIAAKLADDANPTSSSDFDNDNNRWHSDLHKETVDNFPAPDQNCNIRYPKNQRPPPSPSSAFQGSSADQVFGETITQVKKIAPESGAENNRNTKRRVSETIFCLVSVPVHTPSNINKDLAADQNNNETIPSLTVTTTDTFAVGLKESPNIRSKSVNEMPIRSHYSHFHTSSTSSMRNYKRAPLRKEIIDAWALQASEDKELCYAGSWPGNQYRNQETQTGSPLTVVKSPEPQSPPGVQEPIQSVSDTTTDSGVGTDSNSSYGYPMAGQKNLHPSSNSAFSRLSVSPTQPSSLQPAQQDPSSPSKGHDQGGQQPSSPRKNNCSPPESAEQVVFGQFLLKPVNRRPCDAIGELESINKEMEDTISKRPNVAQCTDDLDGGNKRLAWFKSGAHFTAGPEPGREAISLPPLGEVNLSICRTRSESSRSPQRDSSPRITRLSREVSFVFEDDNGDERYAISEPLTYKNESTIADKHLENLLIQEKANALPTEDLSNLYEVKCAKGIPENESIEQRAARILGIAVPVEALGVADKQCDDNQDDADATISEERQSPNEEMQQVIGECENVKEESLDVQGADVEDVEETGLCVDQEEQDKHDKQKHSDDHSDGEDNLGPETQTILDLPEFPPSKLPLSLPFTADEKLALSICSGEKKGRGGACKLIESLQDKLNSSAASSASSLGRSTTDRMARLKELDSVSRIRRLSLKGPESEEEADSKERDEDTEESENQEETKEEVVEQQTETEEKEVEEGGSAEEQNPNEGENAHETHDKLGDSEDYSYDPSRVERV
uniref:Junctional cadherin 5 associated n=1 Tax=Stegastes partitus TaxID=144197 RepID=A0A3B4ZWI8_9TELE